jgi:hypothetical protein
MSHPVPVNSTARLASSVVFLTGASLALAFPVLALDVGGVWEVVEEERTYQATVDGTGNGTYTWQHGILFNSKIEGTRWSGSWKQSGNDREGGFTIELSADGTSAKGRWWYSRVGTQVIPDPDFGGDYTWRKLSPAALVP